MAEPAPALDFDVGGALKAGYTEHEIASYLGGQSGFDVESARKAGYNSTEIIHHLALPAPPPAAKEEVAPQPVSGTALGMAKAAGQTVLETVPKLEVGVGAIMKSAGQGEAVESRRDIDLMHRLDQGEDFGALMKSAPNDLARLALAQYRRASPEEKATMRQDAINTVAAPPGALERGGANVLAAGQHGAEEAKRLIPLTPEEEGRTSVVVAKTAASLLTFLAAAGPAGVPGMVAYGGVESYGKTYEEAKKAGASDEDATVAAAISGVVQGGLNAVPAHKALAVADQIPKMFKGEFIKTLTEMAKSGGTLLGFTQVSQLADNYIAKETFEPTRDLKQGLGENMGPTFGVGALLPVVPAVAARAFRPRTPAEVAKPVMEAKTTDEAIAAAQRTVAEGTPVDISEITRNAEYGTTTEQNQARLLKLFGGMNEGTVEQAGEGAYHYRTEVDGQEQTVPLKVWDPAKPLAEGETTQATISPDLAAAQRKHYDSLGVKVVYFENDARIPFDGAVDPRQPDTIFLSNDPQRNAAQIGAHEVTHLLENTKLPDGTNLGDLLHDQVRAGMTPEGRAYAEKLFGGTAPKREAFGPGVEGDSAHADAVVKHLITELGADIGAEAPKFQTFAPRVVEAIEQRYGAEAAKGVLQKLIAGFKNALDTMRNFFSRADEHPEYGQTPTVSQHWVTNLSDIHDTLAKMYAVRFGERVERENAALTGMREKVQRDRFLTNFERPGAEVPPPTAPEGFAAPRPAEEPARAPSETPAAAIPPEAPRPPGPMSDSAAYAEAATRAAMYRRWLGELDDQRRSTAPASPQAALLKQTEAAILGKVAGVEARLTQTQTERLAAVRSQIDALHNPTTPSADMVKVQQALEAEHAKMARAASIGSPAAPIREGVAERPQTEVRQRGEAVMPAARDKIFAQERGAEVAPVAAGPQPVAAAAAPPRAAPQPRAPVEAPVLSPFAAKVKAERERLWAEEMPGYKREGGTTRQGLASASAGNERMVTESARDKVMREEIGEDAVMDAIERGLTDDQIFSVARFYRPEEGKTPQESFREAVDRYAALEHEQALREEAAGLFDPDYDVLAPDTPEGAATLDTYRKMEEANARERAANEAPFESGEADGNGRPPAPEVPERSSGEEAGGQSGGRGEVSGEEQGGDALKFSPRQTETPEFKEWFRSSKVVDAEGKPEIVYHGTDKDFHAFDPEKSIGGLIWFTNDRAQIESGESGAAGRSKIMEMYASIQKPAGWREYDKFGIAELQARGFDGVILPEKDGTFTGIAFEPTQVKSATDNSGAFDPANPDIRFSPKREEPFYSALTRGVEALKLEKATPGQWAATIANMPGIKAEERAWSGVEDWLKTQAKSVTKAEVLEHLRENEVQVSEIEKRAMPSADMQRNEIANRMYDTDYFQLASSQKHLVDEALDSQSVQGAKFSDFTLPGGENYRELLLTLPDKAGLPGAAAADNFRGVHWNEPNVLAHVRFNDRTVDGKRTLFLEEVQSDWHQRGRQNGYSWGDALSPEEGAQLKRLSEKREAGTSTPEEIQELRALHERQRAVEIGNKNRVPDAPFKTTWPELAMKRMLRYAAENGYEAIAWAPGAAHVERFSEALRKEVDHLEWEKTPEGIHLVGYKTFGPSTYHIEPGVARWLVLNERDQIVETHDGRADAEAAIKRLESAPDRESGGRQKVVDTTEKETVLSDAIGKALGQKIISDEGQKGTMSGKDLRIDDTGMAGFYDRMLPAIANKIGKKFGAKVENATIEKPHDMADAKWEGPDLTPDEIRDSIPRDDVRVAAQLKEIAKAVDEGMGMADAVETFGSEAAARALDGRLLSLRGNEPVHSILITPAMRESVMQGQPLFSPRVRTPEQIEADKAFASDKTVMEKIRGKLENLPENAVIQTLDRFYGVKADDPLGYMGLRLSNNAAGATEAFMAASTLRFDGRTYNWKERTGGVEALVKGLGVEAMDFAKWIAGHRAEILKGEGRENLLNDTQIRGLKSLNQGSLAEPYTLASGNATMSREAAYLDALKKYHDLNKNVMDLAVEGGLITRKAADDLLKNPFYIPFYRVDPRDGDQFVAPNSSSASVKQTAFKKLKGGTEQLNDLWENATSNWAHLIEASLKNKNTIPVLKTAVQQGAAVKITAQEAAHLSDKEQKANTVWVMENGEKQFYRIEDKGLFAAVSVLDPVINIPVISPLARGAKNLLQTGITMNPAFAVRNVIRDTQQVIATTPISWNVANNLYTGFKENNAGRAIENLGRAIAGKELKDAGMSDTALSALASGALMRFGDVADAGVRQTKIKVGNRLETPEAVDAFWEGLKTAGGAYRKAMAQSEDVSRIALFKQLKDQGLPTDFAAFSAKDIADFSLTGAAQLVRTLNSMSAFTNARMQGLYKVARSTADADGNVPLAVGTRVGLGIAKRVATVVLAGMLVDLGLDALYANDEDWKKRDEFDKNSNYWFKIGKTEFRIPKGFEVGAVSRLGAIFVESFYDKEMTAGRALTNAYSLLANNLNLNPTPTILKPALDIYGNGNAASGNPIVPRGLERLQAEQRYTINNTMQARGLSAAMNATMRTAGINTDGLSPIQIDYLARAYGGWLATTSMQMGDTVARSFTSEPVRPAEDRMSYWTGGIVSSEPRSASRYVNLLYEQGDGIEKAYATYRDMLAQGHAAEAQKFFAANKDELQKHGLVSGVMRLESNLNKQIRMITNNPDPRVTAEQKRLQIQHLQAVKSRAAEQVFGAH